MDTNDIVQTIQQVLTELVHQSEIPTVEVE